MLNMELELTIPRPRVACSSNRASQASQCSYILIMKFKKKADFTGSQPSHTGFRTQEGCTLGFMFCC